MVHRLYVYISLLFSCMLVHGSPPAGLLLSTIVPIPKDKRAEIVVIQEITGLSLWEAYFAKCLIILFWINTMII